LYCLVCLVWFGLILESNRVSTLVLVLVVLFLIPFRCIYLFVNTVVVVILMEFLIRFEYLIVVVVLVVLVVVVETVDLFG
jgi:hypothetical protein